MDTLIKYRKESESNYPYSIRYLKKIKYHYSHESFIVPWQMYDIKKEEEKVK
jgi:hypothetical protein